MRQAATPIGGLYYGWIIVLACNLVACITWGVTIFNQGVFVAHFIDIYGWSPAALSVGPVLFHIWGGIAGIVIGRIVDRHGPRPILLAGAFVICLAMFGFTVVGAVWHTYVVFILLGTGFACIHTVTLGKIVARWFVRNRSRAMAAATIGAGVGGAVLVPLNAAMIMSYGVVGGAAALAAITLAIIVPLAVWIIKDGPEVLGLLPDGDVAAEPRSDLPGNDAVGGETDGDTRSWTIRQAMGTTVFWGLSLCLSLGMVAQSAFLFHQVPFLNASLGLLGAATLVTVTTIAGLIGRSAFILIGDRLALKTWLAAMFAIQASAFMVLVVATDTLGLAIGCCLFGFTMGIVVTLQPLITARCFGRQSFGRIYGPIYFAVRVGAAAGPGIGGIVYAGAGSYTYVWLILAASLTISLLAVPWVIRPADASSAGGSQRL